MVPGQDTLSSGVTGLTPSLFLAGDGSALAGAELRVAEVTPAVGQGGSWVNSPQPGLGGICRPG